MAITTYEDKKIYYPWTRAMIGNIFTKSFSPLTQLRKASHHLVVHIDPSEKRPLIYFGLTQPEGNQVLRDLHMSAWRRPRTQCSSGQCLP